MQLSKEFVAEMLRRKVEYVAEDYVNNFSGDLNVDLELVKVKINMILEHFSNLHTIRAHTKSVDYINNQIRIEVKFVGHREIEWQTICCLVPIATEFIDHDELENPVI